MRIRCRLYSLLLIGMTAGCAEKSQPTRISEPAVAAKPPVTKVAVDPQPTSVPQTTAKPPASAEPSETPIEPEIAPDEPAVEMEAELETPFLLEDGFKALSLEDFKSFGAEPDTWSATDQILVCTGKPKGYLYSQDGYQDFTWRLEYRFERPKSLKDEAKFKGNTGFLVYISGEPKLWPVCLEVQGKHVQMAAIKENGGAAPVTVHEDEAVRQTARKPVGQWNRLEIVSRDGALTVKLNDELISRSEPNFLSEGKIGIQAEDHPFAVRRMRIRAD